LFPELVIIEKKRRAKTPFAMTQRISYKQTNNEVNKQASNIKDLQLNFLSFVFFCIIYFRDKSGGNPIKEI